ncbi:MAG: DUF4743 domain-containing protein [Chromatiales bacterium]|nr:DUF4743 domain-containing protein [Chromatiales bacterium]
MSYLRRIQSCNHYDLERFQGFYIDGQRVGWIRKDALNHIERHPETFTRQEDGIHLHRQLSGFRERSDALATVLIDLVRQGVLAKIRNEPYPVTAGPRGQAVCLVDRAAAGFFGIRAFGQHLNGYCRTADGIEMWLGRRAKDRGLYPGRLDQLVAGGLPHGISLRDNLRKECQEEAGIAQTLADQARPVGTVSYLTESPRGLKPDVLYCYDLELAADFQPVCTDGEVDEFLRLPLQEVARIVCETEEFKPNCNLVVIDFLIRHGALEPEHPDYQELVSGLHVSLP